MFRKFIIVICVSSLLFVASSCGHKTDVNSNISTDNLGTDSSIQNVTMSNTSEPQKTYGDFVMPVKGIRPVAVMIDNQGARPLPQGGLYKAQVIYEIIVEGGITRLMPVFWGTVPELIGPVRSSRHYFLDYAMENDAIYVHFGFSPMAKADITKFRINNVNGIYVGGVFWDLTKDKGNWQDSYTSMQNIMKYSSKVKYRTTTDNTPVFAYNSDNLEIQDGQIAEKVEIYYSSDYKCGFTYDSSTETYLRTRQGKPQVERITGKQLSADNIIIQFVGNRTIDGDDKDRQELGDVGSGNGWFITCGKTEKIKWSKHDRSSPTSYKDLKGNIIKLNPGQTWVEITPSNAKIAIE